MIAGFRQADLALMRPADQVTVRTCGQGFRPPGWPAGVMLLNLDPGLLPALPIWPAGAAADGRLEVGSRSVIGGQLAGNGIGRPAVSWDLDLQLAPGGQPARPTAANVAVDAAEATSCSATWSQ